MSVRPRRHSLALPLALALAACGPSGALSSTAPATAPASSATVPSTAPANVPEAGQTDTAWGRIWDAVPAGFPRFPGATPADDATGEPASARVSVEGGDPLAIAQWMQDALETATFSTEAMNGPGEDGEYVIDSAGDGDCRMQTRIAPLGDRTFVAVLYGAACPAA